jgi:Bacterial Ig-like domain
VIVSSIGLDDVKISTLAPDTTKPSTSATRSVEPNTAGWNKENVSVKLNATDDQGGWGVQKITYSASGAQTIAPTDASGNSVDVKLDQEGTTTLTYYATDKAKNVEDEQSLQVKIDKTPPKVDVNAISPAENATRVSPSAKIRATFLEEGSGIDPSTINADTFQVYQVTRSGNVSVPGTISYDESSKTVTFTPSSPLAKATTYQAIVYGTLGSNPGVEDKADNKLYPYHTWWFSTGSRIAL